MKYLFTLWAIAIAFIAQSQGFCGTSYDPNAIEPHQVNFQISNRNIGWKTIPTVVHIVYHDSIENTFFSEDYVHEAMESVNQYFAEASINFDYDINYKDLADYEWAEGVLSGQICFPTYGTQNTILANDLNALWDRNNYCNIYIIPNMCEYLLGWSYITNYPNNKRDGAWVNSNAFGFGEWLPSRNNQNKVLIHELGHYCGLHHVFTGVSSCLQNADLHDSLGHIYGDLVKDTPPIVPSWSCNDAACNWVYWPEYPPSWNSSRPWANYEHNNHMDYYPDSCRQAFTPGQIERMHLKLEFQRASLFGGPNFCFGDLNGDNFVGILDLLQVISSFGENSLTGDLDNNGIVNVQDLNWVLNMFNTNCIDPEAAFFHPKPENTRELLKALEQIK